MPNNIGFISLWFERGQGYASKKLISVFEKNGDNIYVLARPGIINNNLMLGYEGEWNIKNLIAYPTYEIDPDFILFWIEKFNLTHIIFIEEQWQIGSIEYLRNKLNDKVKRLCKHLRQSGLYSSDDI